MNVSINLLYCERLCGFDNGSRGSRGGKLHHPTILSDYQQEWAQSQLHCEMSIHKAAKKESLMAMFGVEDSAKLVTLL